MTPTARIGPAVSPAEALATFERWYDAHETRDLDALAAVLAADVAVHSMFRPEPARSRADAVAHFRRTTTVFPNLAMPLESGVAATPAGTVLAECRFVGTFGGRLTWGGREHAGNGRRFDVPGVVVLHTADQAVTSVRTLFDRDDWLRQIGVPAP